MDAGRVRLRADGTGGRRAPGRGHAAGYGLEPEEYFKKVGKQHPLGCIGEPDDIAYIDVYLAADESKWTTGAEFVVDGGWTAQ